MQTNSYETNSSLIITSKYNKYIAGKEECVTTRKDVENVYICLAKKLSSEQKKLEDIQEKKDSLDPEGHGKLPQSSGI